MFEQNVNLSHYSNYKIGGKAKYFCYCNSLDKLIKASSEAKKINMPLFVIGGATNLLISDEGFNGIVLKPDIIFINSQKNTVTVGAGVLMSDLLNYTIEKGLSGLEWAGGLPGTVGGAIRGNAGAFGGEIKDSIQEVVSLDTLDKTPKLISRNKRECEFKYRDSIFKRQQKNDLGKEVIVQSVFKLKKGDPKEIREAIDSKITYRYNRHPIDYPNIGSIFKNVSWKEIPKQHQDSLKNKLKKDPFAIIPTAVLIDFCGLRGVSFGGAMVSPKHPNFIVNYLQASANDVKQLIALVKFKVKEKFNVNLEEEVEFV